MQWPLADPFGQQRIQRLCVSQRIGIERQHGVQHGPRIVNRSDAIKESLHDGR